MGHQLDSLTAMKKILLLLLMGFTFLTCTKKKVSGTKHLNVAMPSDIKGFDPLLCPDLYTHTALMQTHEGLFEYEHLKRPYELRPLLASSFPEISPDGLTYTFKIRDGVYFQDDPVFKGQKRKLTAHDVVYNFKRLADPHVQNVNWWIMQNHIVGLDELRAKVSKQKDSKALYATDIEGLSALDELTLVVKLKSPFKQFLYVLAMAGSMIVAPEAAETYGAELINHPVGTGPFRLKNWVRNQKLEFVKNPTYWGSTYPTMGETQDTQEGLLTSAGKTLPLIDALTIWIYVEDQTAWLNLLNKNLDIGGIPKDVYTKVVDTKGVLNPEYSQRGLLLSKSSGLDLVFFAFNMEDPILGKNKFLRKAISQAISRKDKFEIFYNNRAIEAHGPLPPGIFGYNEKLTNPASYNFEEAKSNFAKAKALYKEQTGKNELPPLLQDIYSGSHARQFAEAIDLDLKKIGFTTDVRVGTWPQFTEIMAKKKGQFYAYAWNADYPDPENFLQLLYSKNASPGSNNANFNHPQYDALYEEMKNMEDGPQRQDVIDKMVAIIHEETPWVLFNHRIGFGLRYPWVKNYKRNEVSPGAYKYIDIDLSLKK